MENTIIPSFYFSNKFTQYESIVKNYEVTRVNILKDDMLTHYGRTNKTAYYIKSGIMHLSLGHEKGGEKALAMFGPGSIFPIGVTDHDYKIEFEMILRAFTDLDVYKFSYLTLRKIASENSKLAISLLELDCDFIGYLLHDSVSQAFERCSTRICDVLYLYLTNIKNQNNIIPMSQALLANIAGVSRPQIERSLKELRVSNILATSRNHITILDTEKLFFFCSHNVRNS